MIYVDDAYIPARVRNGSRWVSARWCHMTSDGDVGELVDFAVSLGMRSSWLQVPRAAADSRSGQNWHFDVTERVRAAAVAAGAAELSRADFGRVIERRYERDYPAAHADWQRRRSQYRATAGARP